MGECYRGGDRNVRQFYLMPIKTARNIPTTNRADSNGYLNERIAVQLCLKVLPVGTLSLKSQCQLPVDAFRISMAAGHLNRFDMPTAQGKVCLFVLQCTYVLYFIFFLAC